MNALETINAVNECQVSKMVEIGASLASNADTAESCKIFTQQVIGVDAAIRHTYQIIAYTAIREESPSKAAELWGQMSAFCDRTLTVLKNLKAIFPQCGTPDLYDVVLDYKIAADERQKQNMEDAECQTHKVPDHLFPKRN